MNKSVLITGVVMILSCFGNIQAQNRKWTLEACVEYALQHNIEVKQSQNQIRSLNVERNTLKNSFLPDLNAGASQKFAFGRSLNQENTYEDSNIQNSSFSVSTEVSLFNGFKRIHSITSNKFDLLAAEADKELMENNLSLSVTGAYYQILLDKEIFRIAKEQIQLTKEQEERTRLLIENGKVSQSQLYDVKAQLADDELAATEAGNSLRMSILELMQLMELKGVEEFDVDSINENLTPADSLMPEYVFASAVSCMPQIQQAYYSLQSKSALVKVARSGYYPVLSLGAGVNTGYYYSGSRLNQAFDIQFRNNMQKSIYLTVSIPIFDRFSTRNQVKAARIEENNATLTLENEKKKLYKDIEKAYLDAMAAFEKYKSTTKAVVANQEAHRYALEKYTAGKSAVYEYNEIKMKLADALSKQSQAKYTYLLKGRLLAFYSCKSVF
ncbi:TolC family protein [uncultured Bacteroides sp.]|uniref:TolC family protein n=1 Tax=uncultured Bacteroides sp. TaxID=162156 RepID=UPI0025DC18C0|nr:TolC family protein [uncultured Bacteroides sp.]